MTARLRYDSEPTREGKSQNLSKRLCLSEGRTSRRHLAFKHIDTSITSSGQSYGRTQNDAVTGGAQNQVSDQRRTHRYPPFLPTVGAHLLRATRSQDLDEAFEKVLSEYLELKIATLQETTDRLEEKWGIEFSTFK